MKRLVIFTDLEWSLGIVHAALAHHLDRAGWDVTLASWAQPHSAEDFAGFDRAFVVDKLLYYKRHSTAFAQACAAQQAATKKHRDWSACASDWVALLEAS
jgi:menaquinone-dependent protoporphyrinogen IX oxidase